MASLPTFDDLTNAQLQVLINAFKPSPDATPEMTKRAYLNWLKVTLTTEVQRRTLVLRQEAQKADEAAALAAVKAALPEVT
jgi:hypothetical protein